jgi:hypothetical protein
LTHAADSGEGSFRSGLEEDEGERGWNIMEGAGMTTETRELNADRQKMFPENHRAGVFSKRRRGISEKY